MAAMDPAVYEPYYQKVTRLCREAYGRAGAVDPWRLLDECMALEGLPMHCPVHHYMVPAVLLAACRRAQGHGADVLKRDLAEAEKRARNVLPGFCGFFGACGAGVGAGIFFSVITDGTPYTTTGPWAWANEATGRALLEIAGLGGPRCCKRTCYTALNSVAAQVGQRLGVALKPPAGLRCRFYRQNAECLAGACPYYPAGESGAPA